ncbi:MAG: hypothetical protein KDA28_12250 [Phycisphaerales bacterium]|nr:hypothetical protein [Phycisphaerales bacterium]
MTPHLNDAARRVLEHVHRLDQEVVVVGVTRADASGNRTLASLLSPCVLSTDRYLPDYDDLEEHEYDDPAHADLERLATDLGDLRRGHAATVPVWSFMTHRREGFEVLLPHRIVVCEGIHALQIDAYDLRVFVEAPAPVRRERVLGRERQEDRGWPLERVLRFFDTVAEPTFQAHEARYRAASDVIVENPTTLPS